VSVSERVRKQIECVRSHSHTRSVLVPLTRLFSEPFEGSIFIQTGKFEVIWFIKSLESEWIYFTS